MLLVEGRGGSQDGQGLLGDRAGLAEGADQIGVGAGALVAVHEALAVLLVVGRIEGVAEMLQELVLAALGDDLRRGVDGGPGQAVESALEAIAADVVVLAGQHNRVEACAERRRRRNRHQAGDRIAILPGQAVQLEIDGLHRFIPRGLNVGLSPGLVHLKTPNKKRP